MRHEFKNLKLEKNSLSIIITKELENIILDGKLTLGEKLPSEKELSEIFGVSRNIVREALVSLRERGLIEVKQGLGAFIIKPEGTVGEVVGRLIEFNDITEKDIYEVRTSLEVFACGLTALRITEAELSQLEEITQEMKDINQFDNWLELEIMFHTTIAKLSQNTLYYILIKELYDLLQEYFVEIYPIKKEKDTFQDHIKIVNALKTHDKNIAKKAMLEHLRYSKNIAHGG